MTLPVLRTERLTLRPMEDDDLERLLEMVAASEWWGDADADDLRCDGMAFTIEVDGELAGWLGVSEEKDPDYRHAGLDITLEPAYQDRGLGPEALIAVRNWLIEERGHHRLIIDPAAHNHRAISAYEKVGFRPVGIMRNYERGRDGTWHDGLLMDLLAEDL
ncbi:MAG: aminoglycoside 6-N-acetyltransferase [Thermoleophilaceae bacterium]|nr:aminoglycoside 6-N-acetyltransferase [Thermoleophilaceae bacterium]